VEYGHGAWAQASSAVVEKSSLLRCILLLILLYPNDTLIKYTSFYANCSETVFEDCE
jgi:hypothetical protein